jgi:hypothetical protein
VTREVRGSPLKAFSVGRVLFFLGVRFRGWEGSAKNTCLAIAPAGHPRMDPSRRGPSLSSPVSRNIP